MKRNLSPMQFGYKIEPHLKIKWIPLVLAVMAGCGGAVLGWMLAPEWRIASAVLSFLACFVFMVLFIELLSAFFGSLARSTNQQMSHLVDHLYGVEQDLRSMINVRPLLKDNLVGFGDWSIDGPMAEKLILKLKETHRHPDSTGLIVECSSGTSTIVIAQYLKQLGSGRLLSLEHEMEFAAVTRQSLQEAGLDDLADCTCASLYFGKEHWHHHHLYSHHGKNPELLSLSVFPRHC